MSTVDKIMALSNNMKIAWERLRDAERYIGAVEDGPDEQYQLRERQATYERTVAALRAAIVEALDLGEPVAEVRCWEEPRYEKPPMQMFELIQFDGFRALPPGAHTLYAAKP